MKRILIFIDWFEPAYKAGGPITAAVNFVKAMSPWFELYVFTGDRDLGDQQSLPGITTDVWQHKSDNVKIFYASKGSLTMANIRKQIIELKPDFVYLHSLFSLYFSIFPLLLHRRHAFPAKFVLAPRGMLRKTALNHKRFKKMMFLGLFRLMRLHKNITFHATDETEYEDVRKRFATEDKIVLIPDFPAAQSGTLTIPGKHTSSVKMIFVGRIHPIKNLDFLLNSIARCKQDITLTIIGGIEDAAYWSKCSTIIEGLPPNIKVNMMHAQPVPIIQDVMRQQHLFTLPTRGENFGHAIFEAFAAGRPVLISDQTPWRNLITSKAGWDLPLDRPAGFTEVVEEVAAMDQEQLKTWCGGAWNYCKNYLETSGIKEQYLKLFS